MESEYTIDDVNEERMGDLIWEAGGSLHATRGDGVLVVGLPDDAGRVTLCRLHELATSIDHTLVLNEWAPDGRTEWLLTPYDV